MFLEVIMADAETWSRRESNELAHTHTPHMPFPDVAIRKPWVCPSLMVPSRCGPQEAGGWPQRRLFPGKVRGTKHSERCWQKRFTDCRWGCAIFLCCPGQQWPVVVLGQLGALNWTRWGSLCFSNELENCLLALWALGPKMSNRLLFSK